MTTFDAMRSMAAEGGWALDPRNPGALDLYSAVSLPGSVSGIGVRLERVAAMETFTTVAFLDPPVAPAFVITHEGFVAALANLIGFHDIQVGDPAFDKAFRISSKDTEGVKKLLADEPLRAALRAISDAIKPLGLRSFHVSESGVSITRTTSVALGTDPSTKDALLRDIPLALGVVQALRKATS